jgi:uncharacterized glyoxalase superfamily protein PhnB
MCDDPVMTGSSIPVTTIPVTTIPTLRYVRPNEAIEWLKTALGFEEKIVHRTDAGVVEHAELTLGNGMVMIGTAGHEQSTARWYTQPQTAGAVTSSIYLVVPDCGPVHASAVQAGAEFLQELRTESYGGRSFIVRDPEGQIWSLGEYNPWAEPAEA